jgi:hypothetical protein
MPQRLKSRKVKFRHVPVSVSFVFGSWVQCRKCGRRLRSQRQADQRCTVVS